MASNTQSFPRMFKLLREDGNIKEKREALTYIRCNSKKLESTNAIKEEQYREICKAVVETFASGNGEIQNEAYETLNVMIRDFKEHPLNLFEAISHINRKNRLKILKLLEVVEETALSTMIYDPLAMSFVKDCIRNVEPVTMTWLAPTVCTDNLQVLIEAESKPLSEDEKLEEETIIYCMTLLRRLYKVAAIMSDNKIEMFDALLMDKIMLLAYMGHKRQRGPALKLLQQSLVTNILSNVRTKLSEVWAEYKTTLQSTYCKRMLLLVSACELDWATQWNISIEFLGVDLHRGASLINNLLSVEEKAFKSTDTIIRRQAFLSWKLLVDNFALDPQELATSRRIKLLCIPLNAKNSKTELIAVTKLEVWWHVIIRLYKDISKFVTPLIVQFLNFCFGPLGDTPLLSSKFDVMASPGKRFFKTKVVAIDALLQLLVKKHDNHTVFSPILEERLPHPMTDNVFQECYKSVIHSVGEALLILSQLTDSEMKNRYQFGKVLWINLINYVQESKMKAKELMYKDMVLVITALLHHAVQKPMIKNLIFDEILFEITELSANFNCQDKTLSELVLKLLQSSMFDEAEKAHYNALKSLLWQSIKPNEGTEYHANTLKIFKQFSEKLYSLSNVNHVQMIVLFELWCILAEMLTKYMKNSQKINEGDNAESNFKDIESILIFPFKSVFLQDQEKVQQLATVWKTLYAQFESQMDLVQNVKPNEVLLKIATIMQDCFSNNKESSRLIASCLDVLLSNINYKYLLESNDVPSILKLLIDLIIYSVRNTKNFECETALKALSALLITVYGHDSQKIIAYLQTCKPAIESVLTSKSEALFKEMANMWETIISIFKGLNKSIDYNFFSSYKEIILLALNHSNPYMESQRFAIFKIENITNEKVKSLLEEIEKQARKGLESSKKKKDKSLNKNSERSSETIKETKSKKEAIPVETDSQGYVTIKTDFKFDVNRLTEHQKESLKRRREDIPALYNDLSQSSSQDTQHLQEWFDRSSKRLEESENTRIKRKDVFIEDISDSDANKENNIDVTEIDVTVVKPVVNDIETKLSDQIAESNVSLETTQSLKPGTDESDKTDETETNMTETQESNIPNTMPLNEKASRITTTERPEDMETSSIEKEMNCELQEDFPQTKSREQSSSPSILDNGKRRSRNNNIKGSSSGLSKSREIFDDTSKQPENMKVRQRTLRTKIVQGKSNTATAPKSLENLKQKVFNDNRRGVKRKSSSDSESEGIHQRRKRRVTLSSETSSNNTDDKSVANDSPMSDTVGENENLSRRTKIEMSRLRINMVFDCPLPNRRRSKVHEENYKETKTKRTDPDSRSAKLKVDRVMRSLDKEDKVTASQCITTRRSKRISKNEIDQADESYEGKSTSEQSKDNDIREKTTSSQKIPLATTSVPENSKRSETDDKESLDNDSTTNVEDEESVTDTQAKEIDPNECGGKEQLLSSSENDSPELDEVEDIIENSQESVSKLEKIYNEKQCFIKINKIPGVHASKSQDISDEDEEVNEIISDSNNDGKIDEKVDDVIVLNTSPSSNIPLSPEVENNQHEDVASEAQKNNDAPSAIKLLIGCSSPKASNKRYTKFKPYTAQGRAAHMLGLVTKQGKIEADNQVITIEDEATSKKTKAKDTDNESTLGKKERLSASKDIDKMSRSCSSRQEKIFSNMRSIDYCSTPPTKLFPNLKNDGEKISPKNDKTIDNDTPDSDTYIDVVGDGNTTPPLNRDELPILEWSSANPPSLTASPSASILKRHRLSMPESEPESTTPNKRKRVSFADPPVSKEMGYEIAATESPHKLIKSPSTRGSLSRKDSPLRFKQTRLRIMQSNPEKGERDEDTQAGATTEIDLQCERENELLTKIAEELEFSENMIVDVDTQPPCNLMDSESMTDNINEADECNKVTMDNISAEIEITQSFAPTRNIEVTQEMDQDKEQRKSKITENSTNKKHIESDDCKTQEDIFSGINEEYDNVQSSENNVNNQLNSDHNCSIENSTIDSLKLDSTADSVMDNSAANNSAALEDTVDVGNCTGLNATADSEIFCDKFIRSSTHATENVEEQDTLPVTESMFGSLPLSQDSHDTSDFNMEVPHPELLDSNHPIYPTLTSCQESINSIIEKLTNPLWVQHLSLYFVNRGLQTVGDLAKLSEREVNRIPVKSNSKVNFVKSILKSFESTYSKKIVKNQPQDLKNMKSEIDVTMDVDVCSSVRSTMTDDHSSSVIFETKTDSLDNDSPIIRSDSSLPFHNDVGSNCLYAKDEVSRQSPTEEFEMEKIIIPSPLAFELSSKMSMATKSNAMSAMMLNMPGTKSASASCTTKSVGTCTTSDSVYPLKSPKNVATKSVAAQMALEDLLDEIDVNLVLESAVRRCTADMILLQYKNKMRHIPQAELEKQTIKMLGNQNRKNYSEVNLRSACRACGINKVLLRLPDIFSADKQFFVKVLNAYRKKIKTSDCLDILDFNEIKDVVYQKSTSSELAEMLSNKLKEEEQQGIKEPMTELSSLNAMLKRMPMDLIISHTVANDELIPSRLVLDIALQNNTPRDIVRALESQASLLTRNEFNKLWSSQFAVGYIKEAMDSKESLSEIFKAVSSKLSTEEFLQIYYECMKEKLKTGGENE